MPDLIAFDMGGTTASATLVRAGEVGRTHEYEFRDGISTPSRFIKAGGYMMRVPTVDVAEVGSGAGSIAALDEGGLLRVGPVSAGAGAEYDGFLQRDGVTREACVCREEVNAINR